MGRGLTKRTLGVIGLGNIGREVFRLAAPLSMRHLATDPHVKLQAVADESVALVDLDTLLRESDFVVVCCALNEETHHLLNAERLALMKSTAYLINVARGPIIDQRALTAALLESKIAGAGLDVFEQEPVELDDPILKLDNVILTPHALCWTDECFLGNGTSAIGSILDVAAGRVPQYVVNPQVVVSITKQALRYVAVEGQVKKPGVYDIDREYTLLGAIARAESPTRTAKLDAVVVFRVINGRRMGARFDLADIRAGRTPDPQIRGGDVVVVGFSALKGAWRDFLEMTPLFNVFTRF